MEQARYKMIEQQIRPWNVLDDHVLTLLSKVKREFFVPPASREMTFMELEISLGHGVSMWLPKLEARALQSLRLTPTDRVLEVGSGSGYLTALLASLAEHVTSVEIVPELNAFAEKNLAAQHVNNVTLIQGDAAQGWQGSYNAIILTGSVPVIPEAFKNSLAIGGRLFAIVGDAPAMQAKVVTCLAPGEFKTVTLFETVVAPLQNALQPERFVF
jgi:protein-L-isoaspartate(D-aspartate) O-methyltransferase